MQITGIPQSAEKALRQLERAGYEAWLVGGCLRDLLRGERPHDWDIASSALPEEISRVFAGWPIIPTGLRHGTVTVLIDGSPLEITTYRADGVYSDGRRPDQVRFVFTIEEDLARRDFTINAMAWNPRRGLADPFGGREDLRSGVIRCVGEPSTRIREDSLRILRGMRFASIYGFSVEAATGQAFHDNKELLGRISWERIGGEIRRMIVGAGIQEILEEYGNVLGVPVPEILPMIGFEQRSPWHHLDVWRHTCLAVASGPADEVVRLALLCHDMGKPECFSLDDAGTGHFYGHTGVSAQKAGEVLRRLRLDGAVRRAAVQLVERHDLPLRADTKTVRRWLGRLGEEQLRRLLAVQRADAAAQDPKAAEGRTAYLDRIEACIGQVVEEKMCFSLRDLAVDGRDLAEGGIPPGPEMGRILRGLLDQVVEEQAPNERGALLALARKMAAKPAAGDSGPREPVEEAE